MRAGFNYGLLGTVGAIFVLWLGIEFAKWHSNRAEQRLGSSDLDVAERLDRAEAAIREANEEIANARAELAERS